MQLAGVQCAGNPHFWVNEDGSYQEEGQKNTRGYIWGKVTFSMKCICLLFSSSPMLFATYYFISLARLEPSLYVHSCPCQFPLNLQILLENNTPIWPADQFLTTSSMELFRSFSWLVAVALEPALFLSR